jgi:signal transduction histidine kinase
MNRKKPEEDSVLLYAPLGRDAEVCSKILRDGEFRVEVCSGMDDVCAKIRRGAALAVLTEEELTPAAIDELAKVLVMQEAWSDFPIIVFSAPTPGRAFRGTGPAWPTLGNVTVLDRPVRTNILLSAVKSACRSRSRQYEARYAIRQRDEFLAMLGHELRNPLAAISFAVQRGFRMDANGAVAKPLNVIDRQVNQLSRLVDDLLDVARVTSGKVTLHKIPSDLDEIVDRCVQSLQAILAANGLTLVHAPSPRKVVANIDPARFEQIIMNLLTNAIKYTPRNGEIDVSVRQDRDMAIVSVRDNGVGIEGRMLNTIFDLFNQVESSLDRSRGGLGIGLTLVKRLIELQGGTVRASSEGMGKGSEFVIEIPVAAAKPPEMASAEDHPAALQGRRIVLVEDSLDIRESLQELLEDFGHSVTSAEDGMLGAEQIVSTKPQVALIDIGLPVLNGYQVAEKVRALMGDSVYLIALTGYGQPEDKRRALAAGFDAHVTKPIDLPTLETMLQQVPV